MLQEVWRDKRVGGTLRLVGSALLTVTLVELVFGRATYGHLGPIPYPLGVPLGVILLGAIAGILYGLVGMGLILVYRANRIISFAQVGLGLVPALAALLLVTNHHWPYFGAVALALVGAAALGALVEVLIMRRFLTRARIIATVATIGVAQLLTLPEIYLPKWLANQSVLPGNFPTPFSEFKVEFEGVIFNGNHLVVVLVGLLVLAGLTMFFQRTGIGVAVRASAENADRALLLGIPVASLSTIVWAIAGLCSGVAIFLRASVIGLPTGTGLSPLILLYGLAAAVIGRMERLRLALLGGMLVGVVEQASFYGTNRPDLASALLLPIILVSLVPRSGQVVRAFETGMQSFRTLQEFRPIPVELRRLPEVRVLRVAAAALGAGVLLAAPIYVAQRFMGFADIVIIYAIVGVSLVILSGWAGQISLGQMAFAGLGAAVAGGLSASHGQDFFVCLALAGLAGGVLAVIIGLPALRTQGLFLAVVTFAFAATVENIVLDRHYTAWLLPDPDSQVLRPILWQRLDVRGAYGFYYLCVAFLLLAYLSARSIRRSRSARVMIATRDNVRSAQSFGISSTRTRLAAFAVSGFMAAVAGGLLAFLTGAVDRQAFSLGINVEVFIFAVVGGLTSPAGAIAGAVIYEGLHYVGQTYGLAGLDTLGISTGALFILNFAPGGLAEVGYGIRDAVLRRVARRRGILVPSLVADRDSERPATAARTPVPPKTPVRSAADGLLVCRGVDVEYDHVQVLFGVDLEVRAGEIVALLGTNGAGKSTLLRAVSGLNPASGGEIFFDGLDITKLRPDQRLRLGIVQVPGGRAIFPTLTVAEHFRLARWDVHDGEADQRQAQILERFPSLRDALHNLAGNLSGGVQQQLGLGMAFVARPRLLVIDELSLGLAPLIVEQLLRLVRELRDQGVTVLIVEQSVNMVLPIADRVYFMEKGEVRFEGAARDLLEREDVLRSVFLLGAAREGGQPTEEADGHPQMTQPRAKPSGISTNPPSVAEPTPTAAAVSDNGYARQRIDLANRVQGPVLEAHHLVAAFGGIRAVDDVSFEVARGEILGIIGPNGAGKTTVFDLLSGFVRPVSGQVLLAGVDVTDWAPDDRAWEGLGRSFQDARIFPSMTVAENLATALERHLPMRDHAAAALCLPEVRAVEDDVAWTVADLVEMMGLSAFRDKFVRELSTGSRRVVDLAMVLAHDPAVLILDEPSSGIAQRETEALADLLGRIRKETGCAMVVIEHDIPLVTHVSDRLLALDLGTVVAEGAPDEVVRHPRVVAAYLGTDETVVRRSGAAVDLGALVEVPG
ncbi:MAG TPA: ATP-binding cassette domain-containing protein [Candidatus Solibacter sp.]|nr:ATP-binding cassette domain-containing protein [Candidatus Solibacter sp.]